MSRFLFLTFLILAPLAAPAMAGAPEFFAPRTGLDTNTTLYLDALSGNSNAVEKLRTRLKQTPAPANAYEDWTFLCNFDTHRAQQYANAVVDCKKANSLKVNDGDATTLAIARLLAGQPALRAYGFARLRVTGGDEIAVRTGSYGGTAIADTGAQISVMMQSVAKSADVKMLGPLRGVDTPTGAISGQIGLIPAVTLGKATLKNVPVLVLPDTRLTVRDGKEKFMIHFILSLYALAEFGRVGWLDHDKWFALGRTAPASLRSAVPMIWCPNGVCVPLQASVVQRAALFDSGANSSVIYGSGVALLSDAERTAIVSAERKIGALGGVANEEVSRVPKVRLTIAGQSLVLKNLTIATGQEPGVAVRLGVDVLRAYSAVILDFGDMTFSVAP